MSSFFFLTMAAYRPPFLGAMLDSRKVYGIFLVMGAVGFFISGNLNSQNKDSDGYALYEQYCLTCHGETGGGNGPAVIVLPSAPPPLKNSGIMASSAAFTQYLQTNAPIKSVSKINHYTSNISKEELEKLIYFFQSLKKLKSYQPPTYANSTYSSSCIFCHGFMANGQGVIQNFIRKRPFNFRSRKAQLLNATLWRAKLTASQKKVIYMGGSNPHFFRQLNKAEAGALYKTIKGF